jgi:predicted ATP-dependent endonuclease of OLD family
MKIEKIEIDTYKVFKNFKIDFLDKNSKPLDLVVIAGINGSGKTTLFEFIMESLEWQDYKNKHTKGSLFIDNEVIEDGNFTNLMTKKHSLDALKFGKLYLKKIIYMKAKDSKTEDIKKEIIKYIDKLIYEDGLSAKEAYKRLKEKIEIIFQGLDMKVYFDSLDRDKNIFFINNLNEKISIDSLSTGEKELLSKVFYLFISEFKDSIIMIDEPEISLHPSWQNRIVKIYKNFAKEYNNQIIIATHSPQIVASTPDESLRILSKEENSIKSYSLNSYGMKVNKALTDIMGVAELRDIEVENQYNLVKNRILNNQFSDKTFDEELFKLEKMMKNDNIDFGLLKLELLKRKKENASS